MAKNNKNTSITKIDEYLPLRDAVLKALRGEILTGKLVPGERLLEIELSERLGVSRTPVREALHKLELEGLVTIQARRGARVTEISEKSLRDVLDVRLALESLAMNLACERLREEDKELLQRARDKVEEAVEAGNTDAIAEADVEFHDAIIATARNDKLSNLVFNLQEQLYRYRFEYIKNPDNYDNISRDHREMYEALINNDKEKAVKSIKEHIERQAQAIVNRIRQEAVK